MNHSKFFEVTEESRSIFRELRATIIRFNIYTWNDGPPMRFETHRFCHQYALTLRKPYTHLSDG